MTISLPRLLFAVFPACVSAPGCTTANLPSDTGAESTLFLVPAADCRDDDTYNNHCRCLQLTHAANSVQTDFLINGGTCNYSCEAGFSRSTTNPGVITCNNGVYTAPECTPKTCDVGELTQATFGKLLLQDGTVCAGEIPTGTNCTLTCDEGYKLKPKGSDGFNLIRYKSCQPVKNSVPESDVEWTNVQLEADSCRKQVCDFGTLAAQLPQEGNYDAGEYGGPTSFKDVRNVTCADGFAKSEDAAATFTCSANEANVVSWVKSWTGDTPPFTCAASSCATSKIPPVDNQITHECADTNFGSATACVLTCRRGYTAKPSSTKCGSDGKWTGDAGACVPDCKDQDKPAVANGYLDCARVRPFDSGVCTQGCSDRFVLKDEAAATVKCGATGWTGEVVECVPPPPKCSVTGIPNSPANGSIDCMSVTRAGSGSCTLDCIDGFKEKTAPTTKCVATGDSTAWEGAVGECTADSSSSDSSSSTSTSSSTKDDDNSAALSVAAAIVVAAFTLE